MNGRSWILTTGALLLTIGAAALAKTASGPDRHPARRGVIVRLVRHGAGHRKPSAPVEISAEPGRIVGDGRQYVRVVVTPRTAAARVDVSVTTKDGLAVVNGPARSSHSGEKNRASEVDLLLGVTGPGERRLIVNATLVFPDGERQTAVQGYSLNPAGRLPARDLPGWRRVRTEDGRSLIETPAEAK